MTASVTAGNHRHRRDLLTSQPRCPARVTGAEAGASAPGTCVLEVSGTAADDVQPTSKPAKSLKRLGGATTMRHRMAAMSKKVRPQPVFVC